MDWTHILDIDSTAFSAEDNPFAAPKQQLVGKVSVNLSKENWICRKMDSLNLILVQGYPSKSSETADLQRDQFVTPSKSHAKLYGLHPSQARPAGSVSFWHCDSAKLNSAYTQIARLSGFTTPAPTSRLLSQDTLSQWEKAVRESTYICNQVAGLSGCLSKVQQGMQSQLKLLQSEQTKGYSAGEVRAITQELQYLMNINASITQCMAKVMEHLSDFAFVSMANVMLFKQDSY